MTTTTTRTTTETTTTIKMMLLPLTMTQRRVRCRTLYSFPLLQLFLVLALLMLPRAQQTEAFSIRSSSITNAPRQRTPWTWAQTTTPNGQPLPSSSSLSASSTSTETSAKTIPWSEDQLIEFAGQEGVVVSLTTLGPGYRAVVRAKHNTSQIIGYCEGFVRPVGGILHLDKMEIFRPMVVRALRENRGEFRGGGTLLGIGLILGYICLLHGEYKMSL